MLQIQKQLAKATFSTPARAEVLHEFQWAVPAKKERDGNHTACVQLIQTHAVLCCGPTYKTPIRKGKTIHFKRTLQKAVP